MTENKKEALGMLQNMLWLRTRDLQKDVGKKMLSRGYEKEGVVTNITYRHCAVCGYGQVYSVKWKDGKRTFPCPAGCEYINGAIHIK